MLQHSESVHHPKTGHQLSCWLLLEPSLREAGFCTDFEKHDILV